MTRKQSPIPLTDYMFNKASAQKIPLSGTFELTPLCNFSCRMCYVRKSAVEVKASPRPMMTLEQWLQIAKDAVSNGMLYLLLTGGEPTLWPGFWELYEALIHMGCLVSINTNGSLLDDAAIERLCALPPRRINVTLYGTSDDTYARLCGAQGVFSKVDQAIMKMKTAGLQVKLNCSLTPYNACDLESMVAYAQERELILDVASYMFPPTRRDPSMVGTNDRFTPEQSAYYRLHTFRLQFGDEKYKTFLTQLLNDCVPRGLDDNLVDPEDGCIRCRAGKASFWITWDGWMSPCGMMNTPKADVAEQSFQAAWQSITEACDGIHLSGICGKCPSQEVCHACAAMAQTETGSVTGVPRYLCECLQAMKQLAKEELATLC